MKFCVFSKCSDSNHGGGLCSISQTLVSTIEKSFFEYCRTTSNYGGAFYLQLKKSSVSSCCLSHCTGSQNHAFHIRLHGDTEENICNYSSILACPANGENRRSVFHFGYGVQSFNLNNISNVNSKAYDGVHLDAKFLSSSHSLTVVDNKIGNIFYSCKSLCKMMERVNAINNSLAPSYKVFMSITSSACFGDSIFAFNTHTTFKDKGTISFEGCSFFSNKFRYKEESVYRTTHFLKHLSSYACRSQETLRFSGYMEQASILLLFFHIPIHLNCLGT